MTVTSSYIYWANYEGNTIGRAKLDASKVNENLITGATNPWGMAVSPR